MAVRVWVTVVMVAVVVAAAGVGVGGQTQDCTSAYNYLTSCLTFVSGNDTTPSQACCTGISYLNTNNADCLCQIVQQFQNSTTPGVNATKAYELPAKCGIVVNSAQCPALAPPPGTAIAPTPPYLAPTSPGAPASPASASAAPLPRVRGPSVALLAAALGAASLLWNALLVFV